LRYSALKAKGRAGSLDAGFGVSCVIADFGPVPFGGYLHRTAGESRCREAPERPPNPS
jgi:hypothetical protein